MEDLAMGGYGAFVWPAYAVTFLTLGAIAIMSWRSWLKHKQNLAALDHSKSELESEDELGPHRPSAAPG